LISKYFLGITFLIAFKIEFGFIGKRFLKAAKEIKTIPETTSFPSFSFAIFEAGIKTISLEKPLMNFLIFSFLINLEI